MRLPKEVHQMEREIVKYFPPLRPAHQRGLALGGVGHNFGEECLPNGGRHRLTDARPLACAPATGARMAL
jgi:hypothetical protein